MRMYDIIEKKRNGDSLTNEEIKFFVGGFTEGSIPDYQAAALMMAIYFNGMNERETVCLTDTMAHSGDTVDLSRFGTFSVDKHSTGGVGDKTSLIVAPVVASLGGKVTKMSGRGLGHTGGTVDKLESIPGYKTTLTNDEFLDQVEKVGIAVIGQSGNLTPADKKMYALRDVTATVESIPLITSSIMSKKIAAGSHSIVLDVKVGSGAFMKDLRHAKLLAEEMVKIGISCGRNMAAVITDMDTPLGNNIGNSLEVEEAVRVLRGEVKNDLYEVSVTLASLMVTLCLGTTLRGAEEKVRAVIEDGRAYEKMKEWILAQGGDVRCIEDLSLLPRSEYSCEVRSTFDGYITGFDTEKVGIVSVILGAGRESKEDSIDHGAGIILRKKTGDRVKPGDVLATLYTNRKEKIPEAEMLFNSCIKSSWAEPEKKPLIYKVIK